MNQTTIIRSLASVETLPAMREPQNSVSSDDMLTLDYHMMAAKQTVRVKARIRSITAGKPGRYDLPEEE